MSISDEMSPRIHRVRAYFAAVDRNSSQPSIFDPVVNGSFSLDAPPSPWVDLGWIRNFVRSTSTKIAPVKTGVPLTTTLQVKQDVEATVSFCFESWGKLQLALSAGTQQMNLLRSSSTSGTTRIGGEAIAAIALNSSSTDTELALSSSDASGITAGELIAVDVDYSGETGYLGSGISAAFVQNALTDVDYVRRVTLNVARVASVAGNVLTLENPLPAGVPNSSMKLSRVVGFCDREGTSFFQQWSAVFVVEGQQGERVIWHYPRLETTSGISENAMDDAGGYKALRLNASFRALPATDALDGEKAVCWRSYLPTD